MNPGPVPLRLKLTLDPRDADDLDALLAAVKAQWGARVTTVFPRQGHYALDAALVAQSPPPDLMVERIGDLLDLPPARLGIP